MAKSKTKSLKTTSHSKLGKVLAFLDKEGKRRPGKRVMDRIPTGLHKFDESIGGGLTRGRIYEVAGNEAAGKTTFILECVKAFQAAGESVGFIDFEHALDLDYAEAIGVDISEDKLIFDQPESLQDGLAVGYELAKANVVGAIVVDSVATMAPEAELDGKSAMAQQARAFGPEIRKYVGTLSRANTVGLFINQVRADFGKWGGGLTTPGGRALKFYASVRMFLSAGRSKIYEDDGIHTKIRIWKNKTSIDQRGVSEYEIRPRLGVIREEELLLIAKEKELITERAGIFTVKNGDKEDKVRGREKVLALLQDERVSKWVMET